MRRDSIMEYGCYTKGRWRWRGGEEDPQARLPTFTRAIPRPPPPAAPAGLDSCDEDTVRRWQLDSMMFPPYANRKEYLIERKADPVDLRVASVTEREKLMGFPPGYTKALLKKEFENPAEAEEQRVKRMA